MPASKPLKEFSARKQAPVSNCTLMHSACLRGRHKLASSGSLSAFPIHIEGRASRAGMQAGLCHACTRSAAQMSRPALTCLQRVQADVWKPWHPSDLDTRQQREAQGACGGR